MDKYYCLNEKQMRELTEVLCTTNRLLGAKGETKLSRTINMVANLPTITFNWVNE